MMMNTGAGLRSGVFGSSWNSAGQTIENMYRSPSDPLQRIQSSKGIFFMMT